MPAQVWFRNPDLYVKELLEERVGLVTWDRGYLRSRSMDPVRFMDLYYGETVPWRILVIGDQGSDEYRSGRDNKKPLATYPTWEYGQDWDILEKMCENPIEGQEHRVVVTRIPLTTTGIGKQFLRQLRDLQDEYPEVILHVHGMYSYRGMFGLNFASIDGDPRTAARKGSVHLPSGKLVSIEKAGETPHWVMLLSMYPSDLKIPRNRCIYNIRSFLWAAEYFKDNIRFRYRSTMDIDPDDPFAQQHKKESRAIMARRGKSQDGDKFLCDVCSLQTGCKYFRVGSICIVPGAEPADLAALFGSRDSESVITGLSQLLAFQTNRISEARQIEVEHNEAEAEKDDPNPEMDPHVTKMIEGVFDRGVKLAKLLNPALAAAGAPRVNVLNATQNVIGSSPQEVMAAALHELEARGIARQDITTEMIMALLTQPDEVKQNAIEAAEVRAAQ